MDTIDRVHVFAGEVAGFVVELAAGVVTVTTRGGEVLARVPCEVREPGWRPTRLRHGATEDFNLIGLVDDEGFGFVINVEDPELSEWGTM